ncbi:MAG: Gldg family protein [Planctomycetes bacterium]|nr:Gldg family protein [Planctomycetota bacterium]
MNLSAICAIWRRQLASLLLNPLGYVFILVFVLVAAGILFVPRAYFARNIADLNPLLTYMPWLLVVLLPALAMGSWASERELGTEEQLLTLPLNVSDALVGKWLGVTSYFTLALLCSLFNVIALAYLGDPDSGLIFANYAGWWCAGLVFAALGVLASTLVPMPAIAFVIGVLLSSGLMAVAWWADWFDPFNRGLLPLGGLVTTAVFVALTLALATLIVMGRRFGENMGRGWRLAVIGLILLAAGGSGAWVLRGTNSSGALVGAGALVTLVGVMAVIPNIIRPHALVAICSAITLFNVSVAVDRKAVDWDVTDERLSSISPASMKILQELEKPVTITAFISKTLPAEMTLKGKEVENTLKVLDREMGDKIKLILKHPEDPLDEAGSEATQFYGITPRKVITDLATGRDEDEVFLSAVVSSGSKTQKIEHFDPGLSVEYELIRAIRTVGSGKKKVIGVVETDLKIVGGFDFQARQPIPEWQIVQEWKKQYDVREVNLDAPVGDDIGVLVAPQPSRLSDEQLKNLHDYIWAGRPALILEDPMPVFSGPQLGSSQPKRPPNPMMGMPPEDGEKGDLKPLLRALGLEIDLDMIAWSDFNPSHEFRKILTPNFVWSYADKGGIEAAPVTRGITSLLLPFPGTVRPAPDKPGELNVKTLVRPVAGVGWGRHSYNDHFERNPFFGERKINPKRFTPVAGEPQAIAVEITGTMKRAYPLPAPKPEGAKTGEEPPVESGKGVGDPSTKPIHVVYVADTDLAHDQFFAFYRNEGQRFSEDELKFLLDLKNVQFLANAVDALADDQAFMELRTRRPVRRPLEVLEKVILETQATLRETTDAAADEYDKKKEKLEADFEQELEKIRKRTDLDENAKAQLVEQKRISARRELDRQIETLEHEAALKVRQAKIEQNRKVSSTMSKVKVQVLAYPALALGLLALAVFLIRVAGESSIVPSSRRRIE